MSLKVKTLIAFVIIACLILPWQLLAGVCVQRAVVKQRVVSYAYAQPVYQAVAYQQAYVSPYSYAIGSDLVLEALAEKLALRIEQKLVERQREAAPPQSIVAEKCAKCHSPQSRAVVEEGVPAFFNELGQLTATPEQRASMATASKLGAMPPPPAKELTDDEYIELRRELERGIVRPAEPQRAPERIPEPPPAPPQQ
jgi:uncharacterized membrane protein